MTTYAPSGFGPNSVIGPHQGLRVTFAQDASMYVPDAIEASLFSDAVDRLVAHVDAGGYAVVPASATVVAPGELAATVDFVVVGSGTVNVGATVKQLYDGLYGFLFGVLGDDALRYVDVRSVELMGSGGTPWGTAITRPAPPKQGSWWEAAGLVTAAAAVAGVIFFAPEIKAALRVKR